MNPSFFFKFCVLALFLLFQTNLLAQLNIKGITIDGVVSYGELNDTTHWKMLEQTDYVILRESSESYYLAILSNVYTSANVYINNQNHVKVLHVSYSLGDATYIEYRGDSLRTLNPVYHWKFRDPFLRDTIQFANFKNELKELYNYTYDLTTEQQEFYKNNLWVSHTMPMGSYREIEMVISKRLVKDAEDIYLSFIKRDDTGKRQLSFFPASINSITGDRELDSDLQNGNLPPLKSFTFKVQN